MRLNSIEQAVVATMGRRLCEAFPRGFTVRYFPPSNDPAVMVQGCYDVLWMDSDGRARQMRVTGGPEDLPEAIMAAAERVT